MCDELKDWIGEKQLALEGDDLGKDLKATEALMRKHQVNILITTSLTSIISKM